MGDLPVKVSAMSAGCRLEPSKPTPVLTCRNESLRTADAEKTQQLSRKDGDSLARSRELPQQKSLGNLAWSSSSLSILPTASQLDFTSWRLTSGVDSHTLSSSLPPASARNVNQQGILQVPFGSSIVPSTSLLDQRNA